MGEVDAALQVYAKKGDWDACLKQAQKEGEQYVEKYTMLYAQDLVNKNKYDEAVSVLAKYSPSASSSNIPAYISLCQSTIYAVPSYEVIQPSFFALRQMLFKVLKNASPSVRGFEKLQNFTRAVHLLCQQATCEKLGLQELSMKASIAMVRYSDLLPADFLAYRAGQVCKSLGKPECALVYYNRFVDIAEAIKSGNSAGGIDHEKFEKTDVPREVCLRKKLCVSNSVAEHVNDWVLEQSISGDLEPKLPMAPCKKCGRQIYAASLSCPYCNSAFDFCHITGYPVLNPTQCTACGVVSNRSDWGLFISKSGRCPCCDAPQTAGA